MDVSDEDAELSGLQGAELARRAGELIEAHQVRISELAVLRRQGVEDEVRHTGATRAAGAIGVSRNRVYEILRESGGVG